MHRIVLLLTALYSLLGAQAQVSELGLTGGVTYYIGDLNPYRHYPKDTKLAFGILYRYNFSDRYAFRLQALNGTLQAYDNRSSDSLQLMRDLHFRARLLEFSGLLEVTSSSTAAKTRTARSGPPSSLPDWPITEHRHRRNTVASGTICNRWAPKARAPRRDQDQTFTGWTTSASLSERVSNGT
ncbi:MAG TPA: DUF6089 family protein [Flavobacteriales bacterium]|nr:DUF6089 family protein [Flavobacteriales bacterium]